MKWISLLIPLLFLAVFGYALFKRVRLYDCFTEGIKEALPLLFTVFPYLAAMLILSELFEQSGLSAILTNSLAPVLRLIGIPPELGKLVLMKPFSGSGATALLSELLRTHGADSYIGRCACVCYGSSETVFYISAVYFAGTRTRGLARPIAISLIAGLIGTVAGCLLCKIL